MTGMDVSSMEPMLPEEAERSLEDVTFELVRALLTGELSRGDAGRLTGYQERKGREIFASLLSKGLHVATTQSHKSAVRLGFPLDVVERWFPRLYPAALS